MTNHGGGASPAWTKYDKLPSSLKTALQNCYTPWAPGYFYDQWQRGVPVLKLVREIQKLDREHAIKQARKTWGPDYPVELIT